MLGLFGNKWTTSFSSEVDPDGAWGDCLETVTPAELAHGLNLVELSGAEWPPSAPEFSKMCKSIRYQCAAHKPFVKLKCLPRTQEAKDRDFRLAKFKLDKMRAEINKVEI